MDTHLPDYPAVLRSHNVSRREVLLRAGAGGLAVALLAHGIEAARAQDATPAGGGMPPGMAAMALTSVPIADMPTGPFSINLMRITLEPGAVVPDSSVTYPTFAYLETGANVVCPNTDGGLVLYDAAGNEISSESGEFVWPVGAGCYTPPNTLDGVRNDGTDQASFLNLELVPTPEGTPVTTAGGALPTGVSATALFGIPVTDMPTAPFMTTLTLVTIDPGAVSPPSSQPFTRIFHVEEGEKLVCPPAGEGRTLYGPDGTVIASGSGEFAFPVGATCYTSPDSLDSIRNDGTDQGSFLVIGLVPMAEGTPTP